MAQEHSQSPDLPQVGAGAVGSVNYPPNPLAHASLSSGPRPAASGSPARLMRSKSRPSPVGAANTYLSDAPGELQAHRLSDVESLGVGRTDAATRAVPGIRALVQTARGRFAAYWPLPRDIAIALVAVALGELAGLILRGLLPGGGALPLLAAVVVSAGLAGQRAGLTAVTLSVGAYLGLVLSPLPAVTETDIPLLVAVSGFALSAAMLNLFCDSLYTARVEAETARAQAETIARRSLLLAEVSAQLDTTDTGTALERAAAVAVPRLGDWCIIDHVGRDGTRRRAAAADRISHQTALLHAVLHDQAGNRLPDSVMESGAACLISTATVSVSLEAPGDKELGRIAAELDPRSVVCVPIVLRSRVMGALTLAYTRPELHYTSADLILAEDMAERVALAVENAHLYREAQQEIEERKRAEARIQELNEQLQTAMTETHHRVKNNLQLIAAMLDMRLMDGEDTIPATELVRLSNSVRTLAVIHDLLTRSAKENGHAAGISVQSALSQLLSTIQGASDACRLEYSIDDAYIPTKQCTSLALITNELVSNGIKHGKDSVIVTLRLVSGIATLDVRDNGPGFPDRFDARAAANTGLDLVVHLAQWDLEGSVSFANAPDGGGAVRIDFAVPALTSTTAAA